MNTCTLALRIRSQALQHYTKDVMTCLKMHAQEQLKLTNDQTAKLKATSQQYGAKRGELRAKAQRLRVALEGQLQPGVAANQDSVAKLTDAMIGVRLAEAQLSRDEVKDQARYLNSVQRAQLYVMRERFAHRIREVHGHGGEMGWRNGPHHREMDRGHPGGRQRSHEPPEAQQDSGGESCWQHGRDWRDA